MRIAKDEYYLGIAEAVSKRSTCLRRQYGAVLVKNDQIVGTGYNGSPRGELNCCDKGTCRREDLKVPSGERYELCEAVHAEQNAIMSAGREKAFGATLYLYGAEDGVALLSPKPCLICAREIKNAGIARVVGTEKGLIDVSKDVKDLLQRELDGVVLSLNEEELINWLELRGSKRVKSLSTLLNKVRLG